MEWKQGQEDRAGRTGGELKLRGILSGGVTEGRLAGGADGEQLKERRTRKSTP
jgi:hypothetical protein